MPLSSLFIRREEDDDEVIPTYPGVPMFFHVVLRTTPFGFVGGTALGGVAKLIRPQIAFYRWPATGSLVGLLLGVGFLAQTATTKENFDDDGLKDRVYRLHYNDPQRKFDERAMMLLPVAVAAGALPLVGAVPTLHRIGIASGLALTLNFGLLISDMAAMKKKEGEKSLRSMD